MKDLRWRSTNYRESLQLPCQVNHLNPRIKSFSYNFGVLQRINLKPSVLQDIPDTS